MMTDTSCPCVNLALLKHIDILHLSHRLQSHTKAAIAAVAEALEAAKKITAGKSGKLKDSENRPAETNVQSSNGMLS